MNFSKKGFTLLELIVVVLILAILGTIAFISIQGYSRDARDSVRLSDIGNINKSLELYSLNKGKYPDVSGENIITYSGSEAWVQGTFGDETFKVVQKLSNIPLDPLTNSEYIYSVTNDRKEYQVAGIFESDDFVSSNILGEVNAADTTALLKIDGNYNGKLLKVNKSDITYVLAVPSIITSTGGTLEYIIENKGLAYNRFRNLPFNYSGTDFKIRGEENLNLVNTGSYLIYEGKLDDFINDKNKQTEFITNLQKAYSGTDISSKEGIKEIVNLVGGENYLAQTIINNNVNSKVKVEKKSSSNSNLTCEDLTQEQVDSLNGMEYYYILNETRDKWYSKYNGIIDYEGYGEILTKEDWCSVVDLEILVKDSLPSEILYLKNIKGLLLWGDDGNTLTSIPLNLGVFTNLTSLEIGNFYHLNEIPSEIGNLSGLLELILDINIPGIPNSFFNLQNLELLKMYDPNELSILGNLNDYGFESGDTVPGTYCNFYEIEDICINVTETNISFEQKGLCAEEPNYPNGNFVYGNPTTEGISWQNTNSEEACYYSCNYGYTGNDCNTQFIFGWGLLDTNCPIYNDFIISGTDLLGNPVTQTWAPCNSTLGTGYSYNNYNKCYDYEFNNLGGTSCYGYNELESSYNSTYGVDNIWGKMYRGIDAGTACPSGRHLPTIDEWTVLLKNLGCSDYGTSTTSGWLCNGLGWSNHFSKTDTDNLINFLKIPLSGDGDTVNFYNRGRTAEFWSGTSYNTNFRYGVVLDAYYTTINRNIYGNDNKYSVRCIKN